MNSNSLKTGVLLILLTVLFVSIGSLMGGKEGALIAFIFAVLMNFFSYWFSASIVLMMYKAKPITEADNPKLYNMVKKLATAAGLPMPKVCIIDSQTPNAFATGRNPKNGVVAVTTGIMQMLNDEELEGVIAHELSHISGRDILISSIAATIAGAIMMLTNLALRGSNNRNSNPALLILVAILAPIAAMIVQMSISRTREYQADAGAARITKNPMALASALNKISQGVQKIPMDANPSTAHMFIMNPLAGKKLMNLFSTHPRVEDRIARLKEISMSGNATNYASAPKSSNNPMFK